jgi:IS1 family transposase
MENPGEFRTESFVGNKSNKQWIGNALDKKTKEIVGVFIGARSQSGARGLWNSLPAVYRHCAVYYTDFWVSYEKVLPTQRHKAVSKQSGKTNYIERFNYNTSKNLSFS